MPVDVDILTFVTDPEYLGLAVSPAQRTLLKSVYGLPLDSEELRLWRHCTGREAYPGHPFPEVVVLAGARAGKDSRIAVPIALYEAVLGGQAEQLGRGELAVIPIIAQDQRATRVAFSYARDYAQASPILRQLLDDVRESELWFRNRVRVVCFASTAKSTRGFSIPAAILDEVAFYRLEATADADAEIQASVRRGMVGFAHPRLVKISTPYLKAGILYDDFTRHFGSESPDVLVWRAGTTLMNPTIPAARLARERRVDAQRYAREYEAEFADDAEAFLAGAWIEAAVIEGRHELPPRAVGYCAAVDPSGGGADHFTLAIVHLEDDGDRVIQDVLRGWASPRGETVDLAAVVREIARLVKAYRLTEVVGDRYAGSWVAQEFAKVGISYREAEFDRSRAYLESGPLFAQGRVALLDHPALLRELRGLERRTRAGGKTIVDHPRGAHDDYANATCLAIATAGAGTGGDLPIYVVDAPAAASPEASPEIAVDPAAAAKLEADQARQLWHREEAWR